MPKKRNNLVLVSERRLITLALFVSTFLVSLDIAVVSTAMPTVIGQIGGIQLYAWVFSAYLLTSTVTVPIYGKLADLFGRKPVFLFSVAVFMVGSMACGQAQTMEQLIAFRLLQGLGAGGVLPINQTILGDVFPLEERARITGLFSTVWGISGLLGPGIGGFLTEHVSWRWVFYVNLPLCILSMLLVGRFLRERVQRRGHSIDYVGALTLSGSVSALLLGLQTSGTQPLQTLLYVAAAVLAVVFVWQERRAPEPLVPLWLFGRRAIGVSTLGGLLMGLALIGESTFLPPLVQGVMGATPTIAGLVLAGSSVGWPVASTVGGRLLLRLGFRIPCVLGGAIMTLGFVLLLVISPESSLFIPLGITVILGLDRRDGWRLDRRRDFHGGCAERYGRRAQSERLAVARGTRDTGARATCGAARDPRLVVAVRISAVCRRGGAVDVGGGLPAGWQTAGGERRGATRCRVVTFRPSG